MKNKSVNTALHEVVREAEKTITINYFLSRRFWTLKERSIMSLGIDVVNMLRSRMVISKIYSFYVNRGTSGEGVLSHLHWFFFCNKVLKVLDVLWIKVIC